MILLIKIIKKLFKKNTPLLIEESKNNNEKNNSFIINLKNQADLEINEGNGYRIIKNLRFKDMIWIISH